jgi:glycosyltransferase involved in cell wall biosynthesis
MHARIEEIVRSNHFDAVHADQLSMAHYAVSLKMRRILDEHNAVWTITKRMSENESNVLKRAILANEAKVLQAHEAQLMAQFDQVITVTQEDARALTFPGVRLGAPFKIIPICIDPSAVQPRAVQPSSANIIFLGGMFYPPNVDGVLWFARQVLPLVWLRSPKSKFYVVGARPAPAIVELGRRDARIVVTGYAEDATSYLEDSAVFVVPLRAGGGMRVKILDAWARGLPIVTTSLGCEGIAVSPNENLVVADTPETFAASVLDLMSDPSRALKLGQRGREWVREHFDWQRIYPAFDAVYPK